MRQIEIKTIHIGSMFTFFGGSGMVIGLLLGLFGQALFKQNFLEFMAELPVLSKLPGGVIRALIFGVLIGLVWGIGMSLYAAVYNVFAALLGGIRLFVEDED
ncbi:MAG: hypothetical protein ABH952_04765 [Candidatus Omnitrophota bacterium]